MNNLLDFVLYNNQIKKIANILFDSPMVIHHPLYQTILHKRVKKIIHQFRNHPFALRIENTNICNARCTMCPHSIMNRKQGIMSKELYKKIINEAADWGINYVNLHNFGEPLLDPDFIWKVRYAKNKGIKRISTNTNGQVLSKKLAAELINSCLDEIYISIDAATKETYKKIRIGLDFDKVIENIKYLAKIRRQKRPKIVVDFLQSPLNSHETAKFVKEWKGIADGVCVSRIHDWSGKKERLAKFNFKNYVSFSRSPCRLPFTELLINWDGTASLCCQDIEGEVLVGNSNKESLAEIWQGRSLKIIRQKHLSLETDQLPLCKNCKLRTFWWLF